MFARTLITTPMAMLMALSPVTAANSEASARVAVERASDSGLEVEIQHPFESARLVIRQIGGEVVHRGTYTSTPIALFPRLSDDGDPLTDGTYVYELRIRPGEDQSPWTSDRAERGSPASVLLVDAFAVRGGRLVPKQEKVSSPNPRETTSPGLERVTQLDQVIGDDLIVEGSICASDSDECADGETFLTPDILNAQVKLKDADPQLWLNDTTSGHDDWVFRAHLGNLRIRNVDTGNDAIFIEEGANDGSLYIDSSGKIGLGTTNPVDRLHLVHTDPTIRFTETDGNGASFRLRVDTHSGSRSFAIRDGDNFDPFLFIDQDTGRIGLGTGSPAATLDIAPRDGNADLRLASAAGSWSFDNRGEVMTVSREGSGGEELTIRDRFDGAGPTMLVQGSVQGTQCVNTSSREIKTGFAALDPVAVLAKLSDLPITSWRYRHEPEGTAHVGPVAEDFQALFGLGDGETISTVDAVGVLMAAVQALHAENRTLGKRLEELERRTKSERAKKPGPGR